MLQLVEQAGKEINKITQVDEWKKNEVENVKEKCFNDVLRKIMKWKKISLKKEMKKEILWMWKKKLKQSKKKKGKQTENIQTESKQRKKYQ